MHVYKITHKNNPIKEKGEINKDELFDNVRYEIKQNDEKNYNFNNNTVISNSKNRSKQNDINKSKEIDLELKLSSKSPSPKKQSFYKPVRPMSAIAAMNQQNSNS
jgi:hypothetical protein